MLLKNTFLPFAQKKTSHIKISKRHIGSFALVGFVLALLTPQAHASGTYVQEWYESVASNQVISATSTTSWQSVSSGRVNGPKNRMNFTPTQGTQTVRISLSLDGGNVNVSNMTCKFRFSGTVGTTADDGTTIATISASGTTVVCDLTFATRTAIGFELNDGTNQTGFISVSRESGLTQDSSSTPTPAKYAGPEFSSLSLKPVMHGSSTTLTGKRLSQVSSIEIGGKAATFTATSDTELSLTPAADLAPGTYDLVINSAAGKLTHINAVRIQAALRSFSVTTRAENRISEEQYQEHSLIASMQQSELTKARCIVNGPNLAQAKAQAERLCALVKAANPNIETTVIDPRSTVKNNTVFARVTYGWN